jgi:putative solute:sodium symporter small subunit
MLILRHGPATKTKTGGPCHLGGDARPILVGLIFPSQLEAMVPQGLAHRRDIRRAIEMQSKDEAYWRDTSRLMWIHLGLWIFFGYVIHMFVNVLNKFTIIGFPFGFYMAAQGSLIAFVVMLFVFARQQDAIDRKHGVAEDD